MRDIWTNAMKYLWPPKLLSGLTYVLGKWHSSDAKDKSLLLLIFSPMFICILCLLVEVAGFVLFVLPSFILKLLGWLLLICLFGGAGVFGYEKIWGQRSDSSSSSYAEAAYEEVADDDFEAPTSDSSSKWFKNTREAKKSK